MIPSLLAYVTVVTLVQGLQAGAPETAVSLFHAVSPPVVEVGGGATQRLVVAAPADATLLVEDAGGEGEVERLGGWSAAREARGAQALWTFTAPVTAWRPGRWSAPPVRVLVRRPGRATTTLWPGRPGFEAVSPLPPGPVPPAPPLLPAPEPALPGRGLLALLPALAGVGVGAAWWRRRPARPAAAASAPSEAGGAPSLAEALAGVDDDPGAAAVAVARAVRAGAARTLKARAAGGVRPAHTTAEVVALLGGAEGARVAPVLELADRVLYAAYRPLPGEVRAAVAPLAGEEALRG